MVREIQKQNPDKEIIKKTDSVVVKLLSSVDAIYKNYDEKLEHDLFAYALNNFVQNVPKRFWDTAFVKLYNSFSGNIAALTDYAFRTTVFRNKKIFDMSFDVDVKYDAYLNDPVMIIFSNASITAYNNEEKALLDSASITELRRNYVHCLYDFKNETGALDAPDANINMRLSYGNVCSMRPKDAVSCDYKTTVNGYIEKSSPFDYKFFVDEKLRNLIKSKDFGKWGVDSSLYVNFITNNDITGGNSGSPVLDANGNIIGLAFDGNKEALAGDFYYIKDYNGCVCVDIRFAMFILDKYLNAQNILKELNFVAK
jgi:hypothetical protein